MHVGLPHWFPGEVFFPPLNLSRRAAVNSPRRQGGQLGGTGSLQQALGFDTPSCLVISFRGARRNSSEPQDLSVSIEMTVDTAYVTLSISHLSPKGEDSTVINWIVVPAEIGSLIDNHRKGHCSYNSGRKIIMLKWIVFSQLSLCLGARTVKRNRKQIKFCRIFSWLG